VGEFELNGNNQPSDQAETVLRSKLNEWRAGLIAGLASSSIERVYPRSVYKHFQRAGKPVISGGLPIKEVDDHQSPVAPDRYIALRLRPTMGFYQNRIPTYTLRAGLLKWSILLLGACSSVLTYFALVDFVAIIIAAASAMVTWSEFSDMARKTERYTSAVNSIKMLLTWWDSLSDAERESKVTIANLIRSGEDIIADEQMAWTSTGAKNPAQLRNDASANKDSSSQLNLMETSVKMPK
jgi:hypothetical protein